MAKATQDIDRHTASQLLGVSLRTVDRYIRSGRLAARQLHGRIFIDKKDIRHLRKERYTAVPVRIVRKDTPSPNASSASKIPQEKFYKDLYEESRRVLHEYQQKLEQANYRIGQLESREPHPPLPPKLLESREERILNETIKKDLLDREKEIFVLKELMRKEQTNRLAFAILTYLLLAALPALWFLLK